MTMRHDINVRAARLAAGISQTELGNRVGLNQATISRIERGRQEPSLTQIQRIAAALGYELALQPKSGREAA